MSFWKNRRVVVSGGSGFLGSFVVENLRSAGCREITIPRSREYDLREKSEALQLFKDARPDVFFHLAAVVGLPIALLFLIWRRWQFSAGFAIMGQSLPLCPSGSRA